ncbi:hypothetical protein AB6E88_14180 [Providencia hangzhouensis]
MTAALDKLFRIIIAIRLDSVYTNISLTSIFAENLSKIFCGLL